MIRLRPLTPAAICVPGRGRRIGATAAAVDCDHAARAARVPECRRDLPSMKSRPRRYPMQPSRAKGIRHFGRAQSAQVEMAGQKQHGGLRDRLTDASFVQPPSRRTSVQRDYREDNGHGLFLGRACLDTPDLPGRIQRGTATMYTCNLDCPSIRPAICNRR